MDCKCETCVRKDCTERTKQDDLRIVIACDDYTEQEHKMTNADCIRAMSDEELAKVIICPKQVCDKLHILVGRTDCECCSLEWLKQPAEGE